MIWRCCTMIMNNGMNCGIWSMADLSTHEIVIFLELRFTIMWVPTYPSLWWRIVASEEKERWYSQGRDERRSRRFGPIFGRRKIFSSNYATDNFEQRVDDERWEEKTIHPLELVISHNQSAHGTKTSLPGRTPWQLLCSLMRDWLGLMYNLWAADERRMCLSGSKLIRVRVRSLVLLAGTWSWSGDK